MPTAPAVMMGCSVSRVVIALLAVPVVALALRFHPSAGDYYSRCHDDGVAAQSLPPARLVELPSMALALAEIACSVACITAALSTGTFVTLAAKAESVACQCGALAVGLAHMSLATALFAMARGGSAGGPARLCDASGSGEVPEWAQDTVRNVAVAQVVAVGLSVVLNSACLAMLPPRGTPYAYRVLLSSIDIESDSEPGKM
eukprot:m51a1_g2942 hypothetical protein (202) ;mRNA; r:604092-604758